MITEVFASLAAMAARARGIGSLPTLVLPHPMETRSRVEIERIADDRFTELILLIAQTAV